MLKKIKNIFHNMEATTQILLSFIGVILIGTLLLSLPISNKQYSIGFLNNLFIATSATCVTGLVTASVVDTYTIFGQAVILCMIQIGGLGFITMFMFFVSTFSNHLGIRNTSIVSEQLSLDTNFEIKLILKRIFMYTFFTELVGALILAIRFVPKFGSVGLFKALFVAVSAFCNAGFDNVSSSSLSMYVTDPLVNITVIVLVILGGIGFVVWLEVFEKIKLIRTGKLTFKMAIKKLDLHSKIVLVFTFFLLISGTFLFLVMEWSNPATIANMNFFEKLLACSFLSTSLRTAGFATFSFANLRVATQFVMLFYMIIGGSPGGTAGGIKTTTVAVMVIASLAYFKGIKHLRIFNRELRNEVLHRSITIFASVMLLLILSITLLLITQPNLDFMEVTFEAVSALATVGVSLDVTTRLNAIGKIIIIILMYSGRVGVLSLGVMLIKHGNDQRIENDIHYPAENILIG